MNLRQFRKDNGLKQGAIAEYFGVKRSFISRIENGVDPLPPARLEMLLNNDRGWKTDALLQEENGGLDNNGIIDRLKDFFQVRTDMALAEKLGITQINISNWRNRDEIPLNRIVVAAKGIDLNYLIWGSAINSFGTNVCSFVPTASLWRNDGGKVFLEDYYTKAQIEAAYKLGMQEAKEK